MSGVFYNNPRFQQQRPQPNAATVQRLLDENAQLIQAIVEYQKRGSLNEVYEYEQVLHRNLVYLTQLADPTMNSQNALPPPLPPTGVNGTASGTTPVRMPNVSLGHMPVAPNQARPQQPGFPPVDNGARPPTGMPGGPMQQQQASSMPPATPPQMGGYRPGQPGPVQPYPTGPNQPGMPNQPYGAPPSQQYGQAPPQMMQQMARPPGSMPHQMGGMPPQNQGQMMRHPQPPYPQPGMYGQPSMQNGPMGGMAQQGMPPVGGPQGYPPQQNYQPAP